MAFDFLNPGGAVQKPSFGLDGPVPELGVDYSRSKYGAGISGISKEPKGLANWGRMTPGFGTQSGAPGISRQGSPVEFSLGPAPQMQGVDLSGVFGQFRDAYNQINRGVQPNFFVDQDKLTRDARSAAQALNMSPEQIKSMIAGINPSMEEITAKTEAAAGRLNEPGKIAGQAEKMASILNKKYMDQFETAMPGYKQNMQKANQITSDYLSAKIPTDVVNQIFRNAASKGFATGLYGGGIGRNTVARDLGLTSLQLQSAGASMLDQTAKLAAVIGRETMPVSGAEFVNQLITNPATIFSTIANYNHVDPSAIFNAVYVKASDVYNNMANMAQQSTMARANFEASKLVAPSQVFSALIDQAQYNGQIANANALNAWQSQALPGQFDIQKGQYVSFSPGQYEASRPNLPGVVTIGTPTPEQAKKMDWRYAETMGNLRRQQQAAAQNWVGSTYQPQIMA